MLAFAKQMLLAPWICTNKIYIPKQENNVKNVLCLKNVLFCRFSFLCRLKKCFCRCLPFCWFCSFRFRAPVPKETAKSTTRETAAKTFFGAAQKWKTTKQKMFQAQNSILLTLFLYFYFPAEYIQGEGKSIDCADSVGFKGN